MNPLRRLLAVALLGCISAGAVVGQEIANWAAPPFFSLDGAKPDSKGDVSTEGTEAVDGVPTPALHFVGLTPCRLVDTRGNGFTGAYGPPQLTAGVARNFVLTGRCGISATAQAVSLNVTVANTQGPGFILIYPQGGAQPTVSTLNYVAGQTVANAAVVPLGAGGGITVIAGVSGTDLILDTNGDYRGGVVTSLNGETGGVTLVSTTGTIVIDPDPDGLHLDVPGSRLLPSGTANQTLRHDGLSWVATSSVQNNGPNLVLTGVLQLPDIGQIFAGGNRILRWERNFEDATVYLGGAGPYFGGPSGIGELGIGYLALAGTTSDRQSNIALGTFSLFDTTSGDFNVAIGHSALGNITSGTRNIGIGRDAGVNVSTGSNNIYIGNQGFNNESGQIRIGDATFQNGAVIVGISTSAVAGSPVLVTGGGRLGVAASSARYKNDIRDVADGSDDLMKLRPVTFRYKPEVDPSGATQYGLIAEEVAKVYPELVGADEAGKPKTVRYDLVNALLLNEVQKQHREIEELKARLAKLEECTQ